MVMAGGGGLAAEIIDWMRVGLRIVGVEKGMTLRRQVANNRRWWHTVDYDGYAVW